MKTTLTKGLTPEKKKELESDYKASVYFRQRLTALLEEKIKVMRREATSREAYALPAWPFVQADAVGYERALNEVISLISSESVEKS